jgi:superfamily II DNA or RNA helicase
MAYLSQDDPNLIEDLLTRKEFYWIKRWDLEKSPTSDIIPRFMLDAEINKSNQLKLLGHQQFVENYMNPNTDYKRLHIKWSTGSGKTLAGLAIAMNFIKNYNLEKYLGNVEIGSVFIIGFSERAFKNELLKYPEFGFMSKEERFKLDKIKRLAATGSIVDIEKYSELATKIKKRFSNRKNNGFFKFYGYKAFVNRIFIADPNINISEINEEQIRNYLETGKIKYNVELLNEFKNSLIICDEIHNVYNNSEKNNWGIAIQAVLDKEKSVRCVTLSATPLNNNPAEIVDLLNLLLPPEKRVDRSDFFTNEKELKPKALEKIAELSRGRFSFLIDTNPKHYPKVITSGETLKEIPYLKFIRCPMSAFHYKTYKAVYSGTLSQESQYLVDFALPNPEDSDGIGIYQTNQIKRLIPNASQKWKDKYQIDFTNGKIKGDILIRENLTKYSSKYVAMLDEIMHCIKMHYGKIFIYHNIVHMSGVFFIEQVLLKNGFIDEYTSPSDNTICMKCGKTRKEHSKGEILGSSEILDSSNNLDKLDELDSSNNRVELIHETIQVSNEFNLENEETIEFYRFNNEEGNILTVYVKGVNNKLVYLIPSMSKDLLNYNSDLINKFSKMLENFTDKDLYIIVNNELGEKLKNWLLQNGFSIVNNSISNLQNNINDASNTSTQLYRKKLDKIIQVKNIQIKNLKTVIDDDNCNSESDSDSESDTNLENKELKSDTNLENKELELDTKVENKVKQKKLNNCNTCDLVSGGKATNTTHTNHTNHTTNTHHTTYTTNIKHKFIPARFIMAHSEIEKVKMEHSIERFNSLDNLYGENFLILVGSKILKESYDIKAIQNEFIMGKPDNIPTFIQIRGRAVRKGSHNGLPAENRVVRIKIFTSCLPVKQETGLDKGSYKLSYEEEKYKEKIASFQVIQTIEKIIHENAIDSGINYDKIQKTITDDPLGPLPYKPTYNPKHLALSKLSLDTFNIYHSKKEIQLIKIIIKRLFIELSSVWEYTDLLNAVKNPPSNYETEINTNLFSENNFLIALNQLLYDNNVNYTEPFIYKNKNEKLGGFDSSNLTDLTDLTNLDNYSNLTNDIDAISYYVDVHNLDNLDNLDNSSNLDNYKGGFDLTTQATQVNMNNLIDHLYNSDDKIISMPNGQDSVMISIPDGNKVYYMLFPINSKTNNPEIDIELPYRIVKQDEHKVINMNNFIRNKRVDFDYDDKKKIFYRKYVDISVENMESVICEYGTVFHIKFIEECIEYVFKVWTDPLILKDPMHDFYFKMLYYYDLMSLIMWAHTAKNSIFKDYINYAIPVKAKNIKLKTLIKYENRKEELDDISPDDTSDLATSGVINLLKSTFNRTSNMWIPQEFRQEFNNTINKSLSLFEGRKKRIKQITKIDANLLPIGHFISKFPRIYHPVKLWDENPTYMQNEIEYKENDILIGFDERSSTGVHIRFKIRNPIHNIKKYKDNRQTEKGTVCKSKSKTFLKTVAKKLGAIIPDKINVDDLCVIIKSKLVRLELKERIKKSNIKYFYFFYETRPETRNVL